MYTTSFEISALILSVFCFAYSLIAKRRQYIPPKGIKNIFTNQHFLFLVMLAANALSSVSSVVGVYLTTIASPSVSYWMYFFHALYFIFHSTLSLAFGLYIMSVTGTNVDKNKVLGVLYFIPYLFAIALILTNRLHSWAFFMDEASIYHRGILMPVLYGIGGFYVVLGLVFFIKNMRAISKSDSIAVGIFVIIAALGIVLQAIRSDLLVELFFEAIACLVMMVVLEEKAGHVDALTGLWNRVAFTDNTLRMMVSKLPFRIVLVKVSGLDKFAKHFSGRVEDELIRQIGVYLQDRAEDADIYRYRHEEFAVIFKNNNDNAQQFIANVFARFEQGWMMDSLPVTLDACLALVRVPEDIKTHEELEDLLTVNYQKTVEGSYIIPFEELAELAKERYYEEALRKALATNALKVCYQPIWSTKEKKTVSAEALLRIDTDELCHVSPERYIHVAEKTGLINDIGFIVFEDVCRFLSDPEIKRSTIRYVEVNLSVYQFVAPDLISRFEEIRKRYDVPASKINFEITETAGALEKDSVLRLLDQLRDLGYTLSLDDFGTGYSNFVRMIRCEFECIKIDKSILWELSHDEEGLSVLNNLMLFIKNQGSSIVQEGVETQQQLDLAIQCGCDFIQGFYFSRAIDKAGFVDYLAKERA